MTVVRSGTEADVPIAIRIWDEAARAHERDYVLPDRVEKAIGYALLPGSSLLIAEREKKIVGMIMVGQGRSNGGAGDPIVGLAHIGLIAVAPGFWSQGVGRSLVLAALSGAREAGFAEAQLWVRDDNIRACRLYESVGFRMTDDAMKNDLGKIMHRHVISL